MVKIPKVWVLYAKENCPYCKKAYDFLTERDEIVSKIQMTPDNKKHYYEKIDKLTDSYRYFPIIFYDRKFIGGFYELEKMKL